MAKFKFDTKLLKSLKPSKFFSIVRERAARFRKASGKSIVEEYPINSLARKLHPDFQFVKIARIDEHKNCDAKTFTFVPDAEKGTDALAYFSAGQYISVFLEINGLKMTRAYSLSSSPRESLPQEESAPNANENILCPKANLVLRNENESGSGRNSLSRNENKPADEKSGFYQITVKSVGGGLVSSYVLENWKIGTEVVLSAPEGSFSYVSLRDAETVVGIAGGSGITPFLSMARSVQSGDEDFNLVLLYGNRNKDSILFKEELDEIQRKSEKIRVVYVLSDEKSAVENKLAAENKFATENKFVAENNVSGSEKNISGNADELSSENKSDSESVYEFGFINAELVKKYAPSSPYSVFLAGPQAMYDFMDKELSKLNIERKYIRREMYGEIHGAKRQENYPGTAKSEVTIKVTVCDEQKTAKGNPDDTILQILEKNGIAVPSRCRSGECGWCHSLLKSGKVFVPETLDYRRKADLKYNFIHPCCTFALSDLELDIPPAR